MKRISAPLAIGIIAVLAAIVVGCIYFYQKGKIGSIKPPVIQQSAPQPQAQDITKDWKIYRNEKFGFEFKYPSTATVKYEGPSDLDYYYDDKTGFEVDLQIGLNTPSVFLYISKNLFFKAMERVLATSTFESKDAIYKGKLEFNLSSQSAKLDSIFISIKVSDKNNNLITISKDITNSKIKTFDKEYMSLLMNNASSEQQ
jgi:hypothetical protein